MLINKPIIIPYANKQAEMYHKHDFEKNKTVGFKHSDVWSLIHSIEGRRV